MRIVATSDCHGRLRELPLPAGDVLVIAGDLLANTTADPDRDARAQVAPLLELDEWLGGLGFEHVVVIAGNHDWVFDRVPEVRARLRHVTFLQDEAATIDGLKFYGSPWQPEFCDWAFNLRRGGDELRRHWAAIPDDTDVLVTHGPPHGILDQPRGVGHHVGCELLRDRVLVVKPQLHVFGHIHGSYGATTVEGIRFANVALCDERYDPVQPAQVLDVSPRVRA